MSKRRRKLDWVGITCAALDLGETVQRLTASQIGHSAAAIIRLHDRNLLTKAERNRAWKRLTDESSK